MPCAYCGSADTITREHVIPRFLYKAGGDPAPKDINGWNLAALKRVTGEAVIKDVCAACNSGPLSRLDEYGKSFLQHAGLLAANYPKNTVALEYDHAILLRWLLKLTYNSSRSSGKDTYTLSHFKDHIIDGRAPLPSHVALVACMLKGETIAGLDLDEHSHLQDLNSEDGKWRPFFVRLSFLLLPEVFSPVTVRVCTFGCLSLFIVIDLHEQPRGHFQKYVKALMKFWPQSAELKRKSDRLVLKETNRTWGQEYAPMLTIEEEIESNREQK